MQEKDIKVFLESLLNYFEQSTAQKAETGTPYVKDADEKVLLEYTGLIGISGDIKGCIYFTATRDFLSAFTATLLGEENVQEAAIRDMVGEIANNISGNASETFGTGFLISVPAVVTGDPAATTINLEVPSFVISLKWSGHQAYLVVGITEKNNP